MDPFENYIQNQKQWDFSKTLALEHILEFLKQEKTIEGKIHLHIFVFP